MRKYLQVQFVHQPEHPCLEVINPVVDTVRAKPVGSYTDLGQPALELFGLIGRLKRRFEDFCNVIRGVCRGSQNEEATGLQVVPLLAYLRHFVVVFGLNGRKFDNPPDIA